MRIIKSIPPDDKYYQIYSPMANVGVQKQQIQTLESVGKCPMCGQTESQHLLTIVDNSSTYMC